MKRKYNEEGNGNIQVKFTISTSILSNCTSEQYLSKYMYVSSALVFLVIFRLVESVTGGLGGTGPGRGPISL